MLIMIMTIKAMVERRKCNKKLMKILHSYCRVALANQEEATPCKVINRIASHRNVNSKSELHNNKYLLSDQILHRNNLPKRINYTKRMSESS